MGTGGKVWSAWREAPASVSAWLPPSPGHHPRPLFFAQLGPLGSQEHVSRGAFVPFVRLFIQHCSRLKLPVDWR